MSYQPTLFDSQIQCFSPRWSEGDIAFLRENYPQHGVRFCAQKLDRSTKAVRQKSSDLGLRLDTNSEFYREWQSRAAKSKIGKKRPAQAEVMRRTHADGKFAAAMTEERRRKIGERTKEMWKQNGHPRGALGMKHTEETKKKISEAGKAAFSKMTEEDWCKRTMKAQKTRVANGTQHTRPHATWKAAWREIGGKKKYYRSRWEANYARILEWRLLQGDIAKWEHEPLTFWFEGVKRGCVSYLPDFRVTYADGKIEYHEVKGWMDAKSKIKIKRMAKYHPEVTLIVINGKQYKKLASILSRVVPEWEE